MCSHEHRYDEYNAAIALYDLAKKHWRGPVRLCKGRSCLCGNGHESSRRTNLFAKNK